MEKQELFDIFDSISESYPEDSHRTIWEIFCHQNDVDYDCDDDDFEAVVFDEWVDKKENLVESEN
jgi:hypothetical protein